MSWEGYYIHVCEDGHMWEEVPYCASCEDEKCPECDKEPFKTGVVDQTNGLPYYLTFKLIKIRDATYESCPTCYHNHLVSPALYRMEECKEYTVNNHNDIYEAFSDEDDAPLTINKGVS